MNPSFDLDTNLINIQSEKHPKLGQQTGTTMTEAHKRANWHPKYKTANSVKNRREYDKALRNRGDIKLWLSQEAIDAWTTPKTGGCKDRLI